MLKPNISFKTKKLTCENCGLLRKPSKNKIKVGSQVYLNILFFDIKFKCTIKNIIGIVLDRQNNFLIIIDVKNKDTYFVNQIDIKLIDSPAVFLHNMYGECKCK